jgi:NAD(P)-dependent dehydrogenase (short-subunit alcohol dehydrogenase family)
VEIQGSVVLVTGANRGLGAAFVRGLLAEGAAKVYGAARSDYQAPADGVVPVRLDITDRANVSAVAAQLSDVDIVINNAGVLHHATALDDDLEDLLRVDLEANLFGMLAMSRSFAPVLAANGGGALVNVLSASSWHTMPNLTPYGASKAAAWAITNSLRLMLRPKGTLVTGVHVGPIDTDMAAWNDLPKMQADDVVKVVLAGLRDGEEEILVDDVTRMIKAALSQPITAMYPVD